MEPYRGLARPERTSCESLLRHDGTGHHGLLPPFWSLLGTQGIVSAWQIRTRIDTAGPAGAEEDDPEAEYGPWWNAQWIPFALDGSGDCLIVGQRSHRLNGRIRVADHETGCSFRRHPRWASLPALLGATATALESGSALDGCSPVVLHAGEPGWDL